jgi:hypothetical protein
MPRSFTVMVLGANVEATKGWSEEIAWKWKGVDRAQVKAISQDTFNIINEAVKAEDARFIEEERLAAELRRKQEQIERDRRIEIFHKKVVALINDESFEIFKGGTQSVILKKADVSINLGFDSYNKRPWQFISINTGREHRFGVDARAAKAVKEEIENEITRKKSVLKKAQEEKDSTDKIIKSLSDLGIKANAESKYWSIDKHRSQSYKVVNATEIIKAPVQQYGPFSVITGTADKNSIHNVSVRGKFTFEQFKKLTNFIKELDIERI